MFDKHGVFVKASVHERDITLSLSEQTGEDTTGLMATLTLAQAEKLSEELVHLIRAQGGPNLHIIKLEPEGKGDAVDPR